MLVAHARTQDHRDLLVVGLSAANCQRLLMGTPLDLNIGETKGPLAIVIFAGETEDAMQAELFELIDRHGEITKYEEVP